MAGNPKIRDWRGRRVWLLGASSGIGAALAQALAERGARLALSARRADRLAAQAPAGAMLLPCDVTDPAALAAAQARLLAEWGGLEVAIYLAGDYQPMGVDHWDIAAAERLLQVNYTAAMHAAHQLLPVLPVGGGLALVASVAGYRGLPRALGYGPGKAALIHLAECLHLELAPRGVGVWLINPGFVETPLTAGNDFAMPALLSPEQAARATLDGLARGSFEIHYPKRFTHVLKLLRLLPYAAYFPLVRKLTSAR